MDTPGTGDYGMPDGHLQVRSYLAVPVISPTSGEVLGGFFFGHPDPAVFTERTERLAQGIATQTAIALDNARLYRKQRDTAEQLQRSLLPALPEVPGLDIVSRYLPAATGAEVGGDWLDLIPLSGGRSALVIGDVMGKGVHAAAVMGQVRSALRAYARLDLPPADVLRYLGDLVEAMPGDQLVTCVYAVHDPADGKLGIANAGHLPPALLDPDGGVRLVDDQLGAALGTGITDFAAYEADFPVGSALLLYTDGLVERRDRPISAGLAELAAQLPALTGEPEAAWDKLIENLTDVHSHDDDVALLYARQLDGVHRCSSVTLAGRGPAAGAARRFTTTTLREWGLAEYTDTMTVLVSELVTNAITHTAADRLRLRLHSTLDRLIIDVADDDGRLPRLTRPTGPHDEHHRGLLIVQSMASRWGARPTPDGKVVWAEVDTRPQDRS